MATPDFFRPRLDAMIDLRHPLAVLTTRLPWAAIEVAVAPKLARQARPAKQASGDDLAGEYSGEFGGGLSPAGRPRLPVRLSCQPARMLAISALCRLALPCIGVRYSVVWPPLCAARRTAAISNGRLVMASILAVGLALRQYQLHQL